MGAPALGEPVGQGNPPDSQQKLAQPMLPTCLLCPCWGHATPSAQMPAHHHHPAIPTSEAWIWAFCQGCLQGLLQPLLLPCPSPGLAPDSIGRSVCAFHLPIRLGLTASMEGTKTTLIRAPRISFRDQHQGFGSLVNSYLCVKTHFKWTLI